jgi:murein DD-endopeptidase MepM/ murein hydrolase activator NlpD
VHIGDGNTLKVPASYQRGQVVYMIAPIKKFNSSAAPKGSITQYFGENPALYKRFDLAGHNGIDCVAPHGTPMYAVQSGTVMEMKDTPDAFGKHLRFITASKNGVCNQWTYAHCDKIFVKQGDKIKEGDLIAHMGNTGFVVSGATPYWEVNPFAGTHLHLGLRKVKRSSKGWSYPGSNIKIEVLNYDNGYKGAIDPLPELGEVVESPDVQAQLTMISLLNQIISLYKLILKQK